MTTATVVSAWRERGQAHLAIRVRESGGDVEYIGSIDEADLKDLNAVQQRQKLVEAVKAMRDRRIGKPVEIVGFPPTITL